MKRVLIIWAVLFIFFPLAQQAQENSTEEYKIGPKDLLEIKVFGLDELNRTVRVSESGRISLPLLGEIEVTGLTEEELKDKLEEMLGKDHLQDPQVSVFIREYRSQSVSVLGAVGEPGEYELLGNQTLLQIIAQAGSLTQEAGEEIIIIRKQAEGEDETLRISIDELMLKGYASLNLRLKPNDIINIPPDKEVTIFVYGRVTKPGAILVKRSKIPTLQRAIAQAGGFAEGASKGKVVITRKSGKDKETRLVVNVNDIIKGKKKDIQLLENDVVYVPESIF